MVDSLDAAQYPHLASIKTVTFRQKLKGYNVDDVDNFLDALVVEVAALQSELQVSKAEAKRLRAQLT